LNNEPTTDDPSFFAGRQRMYTGRWTYKYEMAAKKGAIGALIIHTDSSTEWGWSVARSGASVESIISPAQTVESFQYEGWITEEATKKVCALAGYTFTELYQRAQRRDFHPVNLGIQAAASSQHSVRSVRTANIIGFLPGGDEARRNEFVVLMAHHDHLGTGIAVKGDSIYNGARDNALGVGSILAIAQCFASLALPPRRSVLFLASGAEEPGLLGATYYGRHPTVLQSHIAAVINVDGGHLWGPTRDVYFLGWGKTTLDPTLNRIAATHARVIVPDPKPDQASFYRTDHFGFARAGIPALTFRSGYEHFDRPAGWGMTKDDEWTRIYYHQPCDEVEAWWNLTGHVQDVRLLAEMVLAIANQEEMPDWVRGDEFAGIRSKMK
jgi:Zn-dependent M28 family amino/carboxypeptidase